MLALNKRLSVSNRDRTDVVDDAIVLVKSTPIANALINAFKTLSVEKQFEALSTPDTSAEHSKLSDIMRKNGVYETRVIDSVWKQVCVYADEKRVEFGIITA